MTAPLSALVIGAIPIERTKVGRKSADDAAALIDDGWSMLIFPEGGRSPDGWGQPFRGGAAYLALRCGVPVVPDPPRGHRPHPAQGPVGPPAVVHHHHLRRARCGPTDDEDSRRFAARIEAAVAGLADETRDDWWTARQRAHRGQTPSLQGPELGAWRRTWQLGDRGPKRRRTPKRAGPTSTDLTPPSGASPQNTRSVARRPDGGTGLTGRPGRDVQLACPPTTGGATGPTPSPRWSHPPTQDT